jgi:glucose/arabinose dehydrogenase
MKHWVGLMILAAAAASATAQERTVLVSGLQNPWSVAVGPDRRVYVSVSGKGEKDGAVLVVDKGKAIPFATGLDEPRGMATYHQWLFVVDRQGVWRIGPKGKAELFAPAKAFPSPPVELHAITADPESGTLYVGDAGNDSGAGIYRISPKGKVTVVTDAKRWTKGAPGAIVLDGASFLLVTNHGRGSLHRIRLGDG